MEEKKYTAGCAEAIPDDIMEDTIAGVIADLNRRTGRVRDFLTALGGDGDEMKEIADRIDDDTLMFMSGFMAGHLFSFMPEDADVYGTELSEYAEKSFTKCARHISKKQLEKKLGELL